MKNAVFWDVTPCGSCKNQRFGGTYRSIIRVTRISELGTALALTINDARRKGILYYTVLSTALQRASVARHGVIFQKTAFFI
jgi:hypothetical protein